MSTISWYKKYTDKLIDKMCEILQKKKEVKPNMEEEKQEEKVENINNEQKIIENENKDVKS